MMNVPIYESNSASEAWQWLADVAYPARTRQESSRVLDSAEDIGDGSPFVRQAVTQCWERLQRLRRNASRSTNPNVVAARRIRTETGVSVDANPYIGITRPELEAVIRAAFTSHQPPEVLLAIWAKEGSTASTTRFVPVRQATTAANARSIFRSHSHYVQLGADNFLVTTRPAGGGDNVWDSRDSAAAAHETHFRRRVRELVSARFLSRDIGGLVNSELRVRRRGGRFEVQPSTKYYALSLLLTDALFTKWRLNRYPQLSSISTALNYMQWNMGVTKFRTFLVSADRHRREAGFLVRGRPISIEQWALHTRPKSNEWRVPRVNAIRFLYYVESYRPIFSLHMNLIKPGIEDLPKTA